MSRSIRVLRRRNWGSCAAFALALSSFSQAGCQRTPTTHLPQIDIRHMTATPATATADPEAFRQTMPPAGQDIAWNYPAPSVSSLSNGVAVYVLARPSGPVT
ncbi:MAG TPA: hypothetical protein VIV60_05230, partial [Polyangiaceae bacterium]